MTPGSSKRITSKLTEYQVRHGFLVRPWKRSFSLADVISLATMYEWLGSITEWDQAVMSEENGMDEASMKFSAQP